MPNKIKKYSTPTPPEIDWLWAVFLERQKVYGADLKEIAKVAGVEYGTMRSYARNSPWAWPKPVRDRVCKYFGINLNVQPTLMNTAEAWMQ